MAVYPQARWRPIPENSTQGRITPTQVILHSAVDADGPTSLFGFFGRADITVESHFFIMLNGTVEQYMDTTVRADANLDANVRAVSIETEDDGEPDQRPWTDAQLASIKHLLEWLFSTHSIPRRVCPAWDQPGVGYHTMWGAPSHWTPVEKTCPGAVRIDQFNDVIRPWLTAAPPQPSRPRAKDIGMLFLYDPDNGLSYVVSDNGFEVVSSDCFNRAAQIGLAMAPQSADVDAIVRLAEKGTSTSVAVELTTDQIKAAVREVFADAGQE